MPLVLSVSLIWLVLRYKNQKTKLALQQKDQEILEKEAQLEKQKALTDERNRIAAEMHDDLGSGLTTIKYLSDFAAKKNKENPQLGKIAKNAEHLVQNMSEIIWAMNSRYDSAQDLVGYIRRFGSEYLELHHKEIVFSSTVKEDLVLSGVVRRNVFLITKEILHNFVKYADVDKISVKLSKVHDKLHISFLEVNNIQETTEFKENGNGLHNMAKRAQDIGGLFTQEQSKEGLLSTLSFPITKTSQV